MMAVLVNVCATLDANTLLLVTTYEEDLLVRVPI
jgi:hypothetical protein